MPDFIERRVDAAVEDAIARGDFDHLALAGKPLDLPATEDPDWWIRQRVRDGEIESDALLPPVILLRREAEQMDATLAEIPDEALVRETLDDFNTRVLEDRRANPLARMLAPTLDVEERIGRWREARAERSPAASAGPVGEEPRPRWWQRLLRR